MKTSLVVASIAASLVCGIGCDSDDKNGNTPGATPKGGDPNERQPNPALGTSKAETKSPAAAGVTPAHAVDGAPADGAMGGGQADVAATQAKPGGGAGTPSNAGADPAGTNPSGAAPSGDAATAKPAAPPPTAPAK